MRGKRVEEKPAGSGGPQRASTRRRRSEGSVSKRAESPARFARAPAQVRIIGGQWKRTPLPVDDQPGLRPSPDRVRETLFNWLAHLVPDAASVRGLDLFAGTGSLGLELASRGAARVTLVEANPALVQRLHQVTEKLKATSVQVVQGDGLAFARAAPAGSFDVVFLDPPFDADLLQAALRFAPRLLADGGFVYAECGAPIDDPAAEESGLQIVRSGRAGHVHFYLLQRA